MQGFFKNIMIEFLSEDIELPQFDTVKITRWVEDVCFDYGKQPGEICYIFCSDEFILNVNNQYLQHDYYTDIITFDYCEGDLISGDLFISLDTVMSNSTKFKQNFENELYRVIIHGILHLCGLKDKTAEEARQMRSAEEKALNILHHES